MCFVTETLDILEFEMPRAVSAKKGQSAVIITGRYINFSIPIQVRREEPEKHPPRLRRHRIGDQRPEGPVRVAQPHRNRASQTSSQRIRIAIMIEIRKHQRARLLAHVISSLSPK